MVNESHARAGEEDETDNAPDTTWIRRKDARGHKYWENKETGQKLIKTYRVVGPDGDAADPRHHPQHDPQRVLQQPAFVHPYPYIGYPAPVVVYPPHHHYCQPAAWIIPAFALPAPVLPAAHALPPPPLMLLPPPPAGSGGEGPAKGPARGAAKGVTTKSKKEKEEKQPVIWVKGRDEQGVKCWNKGTGERVYRDPYF